MANIIRDELTIEGLQHLRDFVPTAPQAMFSNVEPIRSLQEDVLISGRPGYKIVFKRPACTKSWGLLQFTIEFAYDNVVMNNRTLSIFVVKPYEGDPEINRRAVAGGVAHLIQRSLAYTTDEPASKYV